MKSQGVETSNTDYLRQFQEGENKIIPQLLELKKQALTNFEKLGFPTTKNEEWKYTNVAGILKSKFNQAGEPGLSVNDIKYFLPEDAKSILLVFENGKFNKKLSHIENIPAGLTVGDLSEFSSHHAVVNHLGKIAHHKNESFVALNTAMFHQGAFIYADKKFTSDQSIHLLFVNDARKSPTVSYPRNLVVAENGSSLKISESYYSMDSAESSFCNSVTEMFIHDNASVEFCKNESENNNDFHIDYTSAFLQRDSVLNMHTITSGGKIVRNNLRIELLKENGSAHLNGLMVTNGETHVDNHSFVDHASPNCYSNELYKGVLDDKSHGIFNGRIYVRRDAQKTNAYQSNKNILLSDEASVNSKPQLEIYADDVKCSHGATTGQLDPEAMFYLRSRGISENESRALLTSAFAEEILDRITIVSQREKIKDLIHSRLKKGSE